MQEQSLDLIDLISEKHAVLRRKVERIWNEGRQTHITSSEWYVISRIYKQNPTMSQVAKRVDISRQGIHKCLNSLREKGIVEIYREATNKRNKCVALTALGISYYEQYTALKCDIETCIAEEIGTDQVLFLKSILGQRWLDG